MRKWMTDKLFLYHWVRISILLFIYDIIVMNVSYGLALWLRFDFRFSDIPYDYLTTWVKYIPIHTACTLILMFAFKLYRSMWRFASFDELSRTSIVCAISMALHIVGTTVVFQRMPISYYVMGGILQYTMWYVVQVRTGTEKEIITQCEKKIDHGILKRCFVPYYEAMKKYKGEWHLERKILFPGYVFMITDEVESLYLELKSIIGLTKLIGTGREVIPLKKEEVDFLTAFGKERQVVEMSTGILENGCVHITDGPLKGREDMIRKIDRHKRKASLEIPMFGRILETQAGLEIVEKR